jgi:hypothetical protein
MGAKSRCIVFVLGFIQDPEPRNELAENAVRNAMASGDHHLPQNCHFPILDAIFLYFAMQQKSFALNGRNRPRSELPGRAGSGTRKAGV